MKKLVPIGLLVLLLCNTFGPSFAVFFFKNNYRHASPQQLSDDWKMVKMYLPSIPYSENMQVATEMDGLVREDDNFYNPTEVHHENDTLYVTLKSNQAARDRFFELANAMQNESQPEADVPKAPFGKLLKQLTNLVKDYYPEKSGIQLAREISAFKKDYKISIFPEVKYLPFKALLSTPPPEFS